MRHWLWAFATPQTTVYAIRSGRGFDDAATVLGTDFAGVLVRDGWAPYRCFTHALHQSCLAHLIRRARQLRTDHPRSPWAARVQAVLQAALKLRDRRDAGLLSDHGLATARGRLLAQLGRLIDKSRRWTPPTASPPIWTANSPRRSPSCGTRRSTPPTGAPNRPSDPRWSPAKSVAVIVPATAPTPSRCSPASCGPPTSVSSSSPR